MASGTWKQIGRDQKKLTEMNTAVKEEKKNETFSDKQKLTDNGTNTESPPVSAADFIQVTSPAVMPAPFDHTFDLLVQTQMSKMSKEIAEKTEKYKKCKQMLAEENERRHAFAEELAHTQQKLNLQLKINSDLKQEAAEDIQYKVLLSEKEQEVKELKATLAVVDNEKGKGEMNRELSKDGERVPEEQHSPSSRPQDAQHILQYPNPYSLEPPLVPVKHPGLQFGNPYAEPGRDGADGALYPDEIRRVPIGIPSWGLDSTVVCSQPSRNFSRPDGLEDLDELINDEDDNVSPTGVSDPPSFLQQERGAHFCFNASLDLHKKCPLCDVVFPPNYDQSKFEEHVESHWKVCPMCSEQFAPDCDQHVFERHVLTHFPENVQSFD